MPKRISRLSPTTSSKRDPRRARPVYPAARLNKPGRLVVADPPLGAARRRLVQANPTLPEMLPRVLALSALFSPLF